MSVRCQAFKNSFVFDTFFLNECTSTEALATSSPAASKILPLDVVTSTVAPAKS